MVELLLLFLFQFLIHTHSTNTPTLHLLVNKEGLQVKETVGTLLPFLLWHHFEGK